MKKEKKNTMITKITTLYKICEKCGLHIRCRNVEAHEKGYHHNHRGPQRR